MLASLGLATNKWSYERGGMVDALDLKSNVLFSIIHKYQWLIKKSPLCEATFIFE